MTLLRTIVILVGGLVLLLCVVILRAETTRVHYAIAQAEREAEQLRQRVREEELRLAREHNPMILRQRMQDALEALEAQQTPAPPPAQSKTSAAKETRSKAAQKPERPKPQKSSRPRRP